jgi:hypothetical protein
MRFSTIASAAAFAPVLVSANYNSDLKNSLGTARIHNKCKYPVYLWSVLKDQGCDDGVMEKLEPGGTWSEKYRDDKSEVGVSVKISKTTKCKGNLASGEQIDITQLEYYINHAPGFNFNFLDVSFVDCGGNNCPGRDKFCLKSGNNGDPRLAIAGETKAICPILSCKSVEECSTMAYVLPDDVQTKSCEPAADMDFYLCADSPDSDGDLGEVEKPSPKVEPKPEPTSERPQISKANIAAAPQITPGPAPEQKKLKIKTETVIVYKTVAHPPPHKRHAHGHKHFHA